MVTVRVPINPATLQWARKVGMLHEHDLGRAMGVSFERVAAFEAGIERPTYAQMKRLAKKLDRPLAFFFGDPPKASDVPATVDFRGANVESPPLLARELKRAESHRQTILDLEGPSQNLALPPVSRENLERTALALREMLSLKPEQMPPTPVGPATLSYWIRKLESLGILVFQTTRIPLSDFRGLSIFHEYLPIIMLNGSDSASGKVFTLFHEIAHLGSRTSGLCLLNETINVEALCNAFAQEFLMPANSFADFPADLDYMQAVEKVSRNYRVSKLAAAVRLRTLGRISQTELDDVRKQSDEEWQANRNRMRESEGGPSYHLLRYRDLGPKFVGTVVRALESERIGIVDACYMFGAKVPTVDKIVSEYYKESGSQ